MRHGHWMRAGRLRLVRRQDPGADSPLGDPRDRRGRLGRPDGHVAQESPHRLDQGDLAVLQGNPLQPRGLRGTVQAALRLVSPGPPRGPDRPGTARLQQQGKRDLQEVSAHRLEPSRRGIHLRRPVADHRRDREAGAIAAAAGDGIEGHRRRAPRQRGGPLEDGRRPARFRHRGGRVGDRDHDGGDRRAGGRNRRESGRGPGGDVPGDSRLLRVHEPLGRPHGVPRRGGDELLPHDCHGHAGVRQRPASQGRLGSRAARRGHRVSHAPRGIGQALRRSRGVL